MKVPNPLITTSPDKLGGIAVFAGTRVPVQALFDYLEAGDPLIEFLEDFPNVTKEHAVAVLAMAKTAAINQASARNRNFCLTPPIIKTHRDAVGFALMHGHFVAQPAFP
jgi:uncharacterized protein (DUF433 family)